MSRLAAGEPKEKAATFAYKHYAMAMLAGTLVTIAGFVPIGFAASSAGEYTFSLFAVVSIALVVSWFVAVVFAPVLGVAILKAPKAADRGGRRPASCDGVPRPARSAPCKARWITIGGDARAVRPVACSPCRWCRASSSRPRTGPSCWSTCGCRRAPRSRPARTSRPASTPLLKDDPDVERWSTYVGRGAIRFYLPLNAQLPNDFFSQVVIVAKDVAAPRAAAQEAGGDARHRLPRPRHARLSAGARPARRLAGAVPRSAGRTSPKCAPSR